MKRPIRLELIAIGLGVLGVVVVALALVSQSMQRWLEHAAPVAEWGVAVGTIFLASATYRLASRAQAEAEAVGEQVTFEKERVAAAQQPRLFPTADLKWIAGESAGRDLSWWDVLPVVNGGPGVALNVQGHVSLTTGQDGEIVPASLSPGQFDRLRLRWTRQPDGQGWNGAVGFLDYSDIHGDEWRTYFRVHLVESARYLEYISSGLVANLPSYDEVRNGG